VALIISVAVAGDAAAAVLAAAAAAMAPAVANYTCGYVHVVAAVVAVFGRGCGRVWSWLELYLRLWRWPWLRLWLRLRQWVLLWCCG
jgi:hypothetical protein